MSKIDLIDVTGMSDEEVLALVTPDMLEEGERTMAELRRVMDSLSDDTGQTAYSSLMDTCPFCGGRAWIQYWEYPTGYGMEGRAVCGKCHVSTSMDFQSGRTAYLPTGEDITKPLLIKRVIETWNRRTERTCHMDMTEEGEGRYRMWECGECGHSCEDVFGSYEYCPHCGAKVVDE